VVRGGLLARVPGAAFGLAVVPSGLLSGLAQEPATAATLWRIAWYFTEAGAFVFGSGLAIVPFLRSGVVQEFGWLNEQQFLDAVAVAMITPGPVVITVAFIGYLVAGFAGAAVAALATFLPCYLFTVFPAPHFQRLSRIAVLKAFVDGVTAAATGAIAGAAFVLGRRALVDAAAIGVALVTLFALVRFKRVPEPALIAAAGVVGVLLAGPRLEVRSPAPERVVFVCEHGSVKSLVAAEWFNRLARERGLSPRAVSRGITPDATVPPAIVQAMARDGFEVGGFRPRALADSDLQGARVVSFGAAIPGSPANVETWLEVPPATQDFAASRDAIKLRIERLLAEISRPTHRLVPRG
jgi:chromate transport protein ChrA